MAKPRYVTRERVARLISTVERLSQVNLEYYPEDDLELVTKKVLHASAILVMNPKNADAKAYISELTESYKKEPSVIAFRKALKNSDCEGLSEKEWNRIQSDFIFFLSQIYQSTET